MPPIAMSRAQAKKKEHPCSGCYRNDCSLHHATSNLANKAGWLITAIRGESVTSITQQVAKRQFEHNIRLYIQIGCEMNRAKRHCTLQVPPSWLRILKRYRAGKRGKMRVHKSKRQRIMIYPKPIFCRDHLFHAPLLHTVTIIIIDSSKRRQSPASR